MTITTAEQVMMGFAEIENKFISSAIARWSSAEDAVDVVNFLTFGPRYDCKTKLVSRKKPMWRPI